MFRTLAIGTLLAVAVWPVAAQAPLSKQQKIERILDATNVDAAVEAMVSQVRGMLQQLQPNPNAQQQKKRQEALEKIAKSARERMQKARPLLVKTYEDTFEDDELDAMLAFYTSPAGRKANDKMPALNDRLSGVIQTALNPLGAEVNKIAEETLR
ncbi:MAG: DUF2059 domain-containing protein [Acidobacteriota bacterium]